MPGSGPKLKVETWRTDRLIPYARNPRRNEEQVERMMAAIREFGFRIPIVAKSDGTVVDGHLRLKAALRLGLTEVPVALADDLSETQVKAFRILANQSANWADWDSDLLNLELEELEDLDFDTSIFGFDDADLGISAIGGEGAAVGGEDGGPGEDREERGIERGEMFTVIVYCSGEAEQESVYAEMTARGLKCHVQSL